MTEITGEWGGDVRFLDPTNFASLCDSEGNELKCKCGKRATTIISGLKSYIATCHDCSPYGDGVKK